MSARQIYLDLLNSQDDYEVHVANLGIRSADSGLYGQLCRQYPNAVVWDHETGHFTLYIRLENDNSLSVTFPNWVREQVSA